MYIYVCVNIYEYILELAYRFKAIQLVGISLGDRT